MPDGEFGVLPELIQFLIWDAKKPPFTMGPPGSPRFQILSALEAALIERATPVALSALLLFGEVDDVEHRTRARKADYGTLGSYDWLLDDVPWVRLYIDGLNPDRHSQYWSDPSYPLVTDQAKAGLLPWARSVLTDLPFQRPYPFAFGFNAVSSVGRLRGLDSIKGQPRAPSTPEQTEAASNEWEAIFNLLFQDALNLTGKGDAYEGWNSKRYAFYRGEFFFLGHPVPFVSLDETGHIVADALEEFTGNPTRERFDERGKIKVESLNLAQFITNRIIEQRAVALYSLALAKRRGLTTPLTSVMDGGLQKFLAEHAQELRVTTRAATDLKDAPLSDISRETAGCDIEELALIARRVDLAARRYEETFRKTCKNGEPSDVTAANTMSAVPPCSSTRYELGSSALPQ